jgi:archaellin
MKSLFNLDRKAVMGVGMLLIFVSTILVSAVAAGVLIRATGLMQESALEVASQTQTRLISGLQVYAVYGYGNSTTENIYGLEFLMRLRAGSPPLQMDTAGLSYVSGDFSFGAQLNQTLSTTEDACTLANLTPEDEYCFTDRLGNQDTILEQGEIFTVRYLLGNASQLNPEEQFEVTFQPNRGSLETLELTTPDLILDSKIRLR